MSLYEWPAAAAFGRVIPKRKIYEYAGANTALKDRFVREIEQITWTHKLAPDTVNLPATDQLAEIEVFRLDARTELVSTDILRAVDRAIPHPLMFEVVRGTRIKLIAAHKRPSVSDPSRWVLSEYFGTDWLPGDAKRGPLPVAVNLAILYERLLEPLVSAQIVELISGNGINTSNSAGESPAPAYGAAAADGCVPMAEHIARAEAIERQVREVERIQARLNREKQFNKRVAINTELRAAHQQLARLVAEHEDATRRRT